MAPRLPSWFRNLLRIPLLGLAAYAVFLLLAALSQRQVIFPGQRLTPPTGEEPVLDGTRVVWLDVDGERVEAWYLPPAEGVGTEPEGGAAEAAGTAAGAADAGAASTGVPALLFAHGNAEWIRDWERPMAELRPAGTAVLLVEYPGYGRSGGRPSQASVTEAMAAGYDFLASREEIDSERIVGWGRSVGGGAVCSLARERPLAALVLQSTFTDVAALARTMLVPSFVIRDRFDNRAALQDFDGPVLIFHGRRDDIIPFSHAEALDAASRQSRLVALDCAHNDCPPDIAAFRAEVEAFLRDEGILDPDTEPR